MKHILFALLLVSSNVFAQEAIVLAQVRDESLPDLATNTQAKTDETNRFHFRIQLPGTHGHAPKALYKSTNSKVYGAFIGYELPWNFIVSVGAFENSIKDYGHNSGRTSNSFVLENRFIKTEDFSVYLRYRLANNYYKPTYKHSWSESAGLEGCYNVYNGYNACLSHTFWNEKSKVTATGLALRTTF
jgi:hypothetical protein